MKIKPWPGSAVAWLRGIAVDLVTPWQDLPDISLAVNATGIRRHIARRQFLGLHPSSPAQADAARWAAGAGTALWLAALWAISPGVGVLLWGTAAFACLAANVADARRYSAEMPSDDALRPWEARFGRIGFMTGVMWGSVGFAFPDAACSFAPYMAMGLLFVVVGALAVAVSYRPAISWLVVPCALLTGIKLVSCGGLNNVAIGLGFVLVTALMIRLAQVQNALLTQALLDAEERSALLQEVEDQRLEAEHANRAKTNFLVAVSQDLRQPMRSIALLSEALRGHEGSRGAVLAQINSSVQAMDEMLVGLLAASTLDDAGLPLQIAPVPLDPLFDRIERQFESQAAAKGIGLTVIRSNLRVVSDEFQLQRLIALLLSNAVRCTAQGGVLLRCRVRSGCVWLQVWDSGAGMARKQRQRIFDEFSPTANPAGGGAGNNGNNSVEGAGLGLKIVQRTVQRLGHSLVVRSRNDRGSMFAVQLPLGAAPGRFESTTAADLISLLGGQSVLLIDDDVVVLASMRVLLEGFNCHVLTACSTLSALRVVDEQLRTPDLIISDYRLSDADTGLDAIASVRAEVGENFPALLVTADLKVPVSAANVLGVTVLAKPLQVSALASALQRLLRTAG